MTIGEVIKKYPRVVFLFIDYGLHCVGCSIAQGETIEEAAKAHRLDLKKFLEDLNKAIKKAPTAPPATHQTKNIHK
ncbi:DUF1858 domain-containing protein [Patescibacteria group bacterium]|nr:DUF1858 domain-containing protein [Patescibacteria group bacterium]